MKLVLKIAFVLALLGAAIDAFEHSQELFQEFIRKYGRQYKSLAEHQMRYEAFVKNLGRSKQLQETEQGSAIYGVNKFSDFTDNEFRALKGLLSSPKHHFVVPKPSPWPASIPDYFDWRSANVVTKVKDQDSCGNSGVFSAVANIEGQYAIKYGNLVSFSEQELIDCDNVDRHCDGFEWPYKAYQSVINLGGIESEADYPYLGIDDQCKFDPSKVVVQLSSALNLTQDETELADWLYNNGPISVVVNSQPFLYYINGIINYDKCKGGIYLDHSVAIVGYGTENNLDYWIIKNSWGTDYGEEGYVRVARGVDMCGVAEVPTSAIVA